MTRAFIIHVEISSSDPATLMAISDSIADACEGVGIEVSRVVPWAAPTSAPTLPSDPSQLFGTPEGNPLA